MPRAYGYVRVSTGRQLEGESTDSQTAVIRATFERTLMAKGLQLVEPFFEEHQSAYRNEFLRRPAGMLLNSKLQPGDHVLFAIHTRAFRRAADWSAMDALWRKKGVHYHYCNVPGFGHVDSSSAAGWVMYAAMAAGAQMESEQRSLTARATSQYLKLNTDRAWVSNHYAFHKRLNPAGKKIFVPIPERVADLYQWWWMRELGFTDLQINEVTDRNRQVRERQYPVVYHYTASFRQISSKNSMAKKVDGFWEIMQNPFWRGLLPQCEQIFRARWKHMPYGVPDYRGKSARHIRHLLHPNVLMHSGPHKGQPAFLCGEPIREATYDDYQRIFQDLAAHRPRSHQQALSGTPNNASTGGYLAR